MTTDDHAKVINEQYETSARQEKAGLPKRQRMAKVIQDLLAQAELASKRGDETARDEALAKASALQLKFAIDDAMLAAGTADKDEIVEADFCAESNTPLIKAKRELIAGLAELFRGKAVLMPEWQLRKDGRGLKLNRRAFVRVYAHESDLRFISQMYTSLIIQMQTMMATDEKTHAPYVEKIQAWRVSYAYGWAGRVYLRLKEANRRNEVNAETGEPGTALVLRDRHALVQDHVNDAHGKLKNTKYRRDDADVNGRRAGREAAERADLGGAKVTEGSARRIGVRRCEARVRGTRMRTEGNVCNRPLDENGQCDRASDHFVQV